MSALLDEMYDIERSYFEDLERRYELWLQDQMRILVGQPAQHAYFLGPTRRKNYSRSERRRRQWL